ADGKLLGRISGSSVHIWDVSTGQEMHPRPGHQGKVPCLAYAPDGKTLFSASSDRTVRLWNTRTAKQLLLIAGHEGSITCLALSRDGTTIASADDRGRIHLWEAASGRQRLRIEIPKGQDDRDWVGANSVAFLPDGKTL